MSLDYIDAGSYANIINNSMTSNTNTLSKFHRSFSMVQGWPTTQIPNNRYSYQFNEQQNEQKVVLRRRNINSYESDGSLLLCHPSENLRKLVPEEVFNINAAIQSHSKIVSAMVLSKQMKANSDVRIHFKFQCHLKKVVNIFLLF